MNKVLKNVSVIVVMLIIGAIIAFVIYWIAITVFHANISRNSFVVNVITDAVIFCSFPYIYLYIKRTNKKNNYGYNREHFYYGKGCDSICTLCHNDIVYRQRLYSRWH